MIGAVQLTRTEAGTAAVELLGRDESTALELSSGVRVGFQLLE